MKKIAEVKKMDNGNISVRWDGESEFFEVKDKEVALYIIYIMTRPPEAVMDGQNSACR